MRNRRGAGPTDERELLLFDDSIKKILDLSNAAWGPVTLDERLSDLVLPEYKKKSIYMFPSGTVCFSKTLFLILFLIFFSTFAILIYVGRTFLINLAIIY